MKYYMLISAFGGFNFFSFAIYQSMSLKNGCLFISSAPSGPAPNLLLGFLLRRETIRFLHSSERLAGILSTPFYIL
jgi:hypothetical protein